MKRKTLSRTLAVAVVAMTLFSATACNTKDTTLDELKTSNKETSSTETSSTENSSEDIFDNNYMTTEGYKSLEDIIEDNSFEEIRWGKDATSSTMEMIAFKTEYPLSAGANDTITIEFDMSTSDGSIMINDAKCDFFGECIEGAAIIDVDKSDVYKDVVVYDAGASDDPEVIIFRYVDGTIYEVGCFYGRYDYNAILFNSKGGVIEASDYIDFLDKQIVVQYQITPDNKAKEIDVDYSNALGKKYKMAYDMTVAFAETEDTDLDKVYDIVDIEKYLTLKAGDEIVLVKADLERTAYYVELPDGRRGMMVTQLAG